MRIRKINRTFLIMLIGACFFVSCSETPFYEKVESFTGNEWKQNQKPSFSVQIDDTSAIYQFVLTLRTTTDYKFNNLWIFWNTKTPNGESARESFELRIANPDGSWIGKNSGTIVENQLHFQQRKIGVKGKYIFTLEQGITEPSIGEVLDVGLKVEKVK